MALTRDFRETIQARARRDAAFRRALLKEAIDSMLAGNVETGKSVLRDYINATVGFAELGAATGKSPKSLMRMLGPDGNPQARNLFEIVAYLQERAGLRLAARAAETAPDVGAPGSRKRRTANRWLSPGTGTRRRTRASSMRSRILALFDESTGEIFDGPADVARRRD
jgi:hypothetical protein